MKGPTKSIFGRSAKLVGLAASLATREIAGKVAQAEQLRTRILQAKDIVASLGKLKGAAMKAGQMLSLELRDYLPEEVISILSQLQDQGVLVDFSEIEKVLRQEWTPEVWANVIQVEPQALASASIGQVHRGRIKIKEIEHSVVFKVQFSGVADSIDSDMVMVKKLAQSLASAWGKKIDLSTTFQEITEVLKLETEYLRESEQMNRYAQLLSQSHLAKTMTVPTVYPEFSTARVLCMSFEQGERLKTWIERKPSPRHAEQIARAILELYFLEFYEWGLVQTDPNFGNYLIRTNLSGDPELVLLDFGATKEYPHAFVENYRKLLIAAFSGDRTQSDALALELGLLDPRESSEVRGLLFDLMQQVLISFRPENQPFNFADSDYVENTRAATLALIKALKYSPPPRPLLFLHRKLGGVFALIRALNVKMNIADYWKRLELR